MEKLPAITSPALTGATQPQQPALGAVTTLGDAQPVIDVSAYLETRRAVASPHDEYALLATLPHLIRAEMQVLHRACCEVLARSKAMSVSKACVEVLRECRALSLPLKTFRAKYDAWVKTGDWVALVNRTKAGGRWQARQQGLPLEFLVFCASRIGKYKRTDAGKEALRSIIRQWNTGRNLAGEREPIPGYGFREDWLKTAAAKNARRPDQPDGWSYSNIMDSIDRSGVLPKATRALLVQGTHAAREHLPDVNEDTSMLRFMEVIAFDDVKVDWRIFDPETRTAQDLWLLIARCRATRMLLGYGMRPARAREDGSQEHLKLRDMKQLCGWVLESYGLPPYLMTWVIERGTATLSEPSVAALQELLGGAVKVRYSSMIGGVSPSGFRERGVGNSRGKASLESHNRGLHIIGAHVPGQVGPHYGKRPADLAARERECSSIIDLALSKKLPAHLRDQLGYGLLTLKQAREQLRRIFSLQNSRTDHALEDFEEVMEWWDGAQWRPAATAPGSNVPLNVRRESPMERAARLVRESELAGHAWRRVSPHVLCAFYDHTQRLEPVDPTGEISFTHEGKVLRFVSPGIHPPQQKVLCYFNPDEPLTLHVTDGRGAVIGTWLAKGKVRDRETLAESLRHQAAALRQARQQADALNADERAQLEAMRQRNQEIMQQADVIAVDPVMPRQVADACTSRVADSIAETSRLVQSDHADLQRKSKLRSSAMDDLESLPDESPLTAD